MLARALILSAWLAAREPTVDRRFVLRATRSAV
jgi:hypothetical protein